MTRVHPSVDPVHPSKPVHPSTIHVSWTDVPHPWVCAPFLVCSLVSIIVTPCGCVDGVIQPLWCAHVAEGRWVHSLGMLPSCPTLSQMQPKSPSIILRKVRCVPPWCRMSPSCAQGAPAHTQMSLFSQPITSSLCSFICSIVESSQGECACLVGVMGDLTSSPTPSCCHPSTTSIDSMVSLPHLWISSPLNDCCLLNCCHQGKLPIMPLSQELTSSCSNTLFCLQTCHIHNSSFPPICQVTHCILNSFHQGTSSRCPIGLTSSH
jgi:hypothetical protein